MKEKYVFGFYKFESKEEYEQALKEWKIITSITKQFDITDIKVAKKLLYNVNSGKIKFETCVGREFVDKLKWTVFLCQEENAPTYEKTVKQEKEEYIIEKEIGAVYTVKYKEEKWFYVIKWILFYVVVTTFLQIIIYNIGGYANFTALPTGVIWFLGAKLLFPISVVVFVGYILGVKRKHFLRTGDRYWLQFFRLVGYMVMSYYLAYITSDLPFVGYLTKVFKNLRRGYHSIPFYEVYEVYDYYSNTEPIIIIGFIIVALIIPYQYLIRKIVHILYSIFKRIIPWDSSLFEVTLYDDRKYEDNDNYTAKGWLILLACIAIGYIISFVLLGRTGEAYNDAVDVFENENIVFNYQEINKTDSEIATSYEGDDFGMHYDIDWYENSRHIGENQLQGMDFVFENGGISINELLDICSDSEKIYLLENVSNQGLDFSLEEDYVTQTVGICTFRGVKGILYVTCEGEKVKYFDWTSDTIQGFSELHVECHEQMEFYNSYTSAKEYLYNGYLFNICDFIDQYNVMFGECENWY